MSSTNELPASSSKSNDRNHGHYCQNGILHVPSRRHFQYCKIHALHGKMTPKSRQEPCHNAQVLRWMCSIWCPVVRVSGIKEMTDQRLPQFRVFDQFFDHLFTHHVRANGHIGDRSRTNDGRILWCTTHTSLFQDPHLL
jgi:hypothetical protein